MTVRHVSRAVSLTLLAGAVWIYVRGELFDRRFQKRYGPVGGTR